MRRIIASKLIAARLVPIIPCCAVILIAASVVADDASRLESVVVEEARSVAQDADVLSPGRSDLPSATSPGSWVVDPIERELRLQRAIAQSLQGDNDGAIDSLADADSEDTAASYAGAMLRLKTGQVEDGVKMLESLSQHSDAPAETGKFLAIGYLHLDDAQASEAAAKRYLSDHQDDAYGHYLHGLAILRQDQPERARGALRRAGYDDRAAAKIQQVVMQAPVDVQQRRSTIGNTMSTARQESYAAGSRGLAEDRPYNLTLLFAGEYDSNVPLQPKFTGLGSISDYEDYRFVMASFLDVQLLTCQEFNLGLVGSAFNTFQFDANQFNIQDYMGGGYANSLLKDDLIGSVRYEFHHTLVGERRLASDHRLTPSLTWLGSRGHTTLFYEFNAIDSRAPALIQAQDQSAEIHRLGITQAIYTFGGDGRIYVGGQYADAEADGSDFDRTTTMATGRIERPLGRRWIADLDVRYVWDNYDNPNSLDFFDRPRVDDRLEVRTGLQKNFVRAVSLRFDYTYFHNDSNTANLFGVRFYNYDRHIFSTQLIFTL